MKRSQAHGREEAMAANFFDKRPGRTAWVFLLLVVLGIIIRVSFISGAGVVHDRQYRSLLMARAIYFSSEKAVPDWRQRVAETSSSRQEVLEPPITEHLVALGYRLLGKESLYVARMVPATFWIISAIPLFLLARRMTSIDAAIYSTAYYLLVPSGVLMSVSFLPEALMLLMLLISLLAIFSYVEQPSIFRLFIAASISAVAIWIKPFVAFVLPASFLFLVLDKTNGFKQLFRPPVVLFCLISLLPGVLYYGYGLVVDDYLRWKIHSSFLPHLLWSISFWRGWLVTSAETAGVTPIVLALLGLVLVRRTISRRLLTGFFVGYVVFCLAFNYYTRFLTYYHAQLIVLVALALGSTVSTFANHLNHVFRARLPRAVLIVTVVFGLAMNYHHIKSSEIDLVFEGEKISAEIGRIVGHSERVAYLASHYGLPLEYYGELSGEYWPRPLKGWPLVSGPEQPRSIEERMPLLGFEPEYFVITDLGEFRRHHGDLKQFLEANATLLAESDRYLVYKMPAPAEDS